MSHSNFRRLPLIPVLILFSGCGLFGRGGLHEAAQGQPQGAQGSGQR